jgi:hypothetical protein
MHSKSWCFLLLLLGCFQAKGQFHDVGVFLGTSSYRGDVGNTNYVYPSGTALGLIYRWNLTTRYSIRASGFYSTLKGRDYRTTDLGRFLRGYSFSNTIMEASLAAEINFIDFNLHAGTPQLSPYLTLGISYFDYDRFYFTGPPPAATETYDAAQSVALPVIVGLKFNPNPLWVLGFEVGMRYALTDDIDGSAPIDLYDAAQFGNPNNNDWYIFSGITISFTFGDLPCYCKEK